MHTTTNLIETARRAVAAEARFDHLATGTDEEVEARHGELSALASESRAATLAAAATPAETADELLAKAHLLAVMTIREGDGVGEEPLCALARSILRDLAASGEAGTKRQL